MAETRPAPPYPPDLVASRLVFGGYVALTGLSLWSQHVSAGWARAHSVPPRLAPPISVLDVVAAMVGLTIQAWIMRGTARGLRPALVLTSLFASERLSRFFASRDNLQFTGTGPHAPLYPAVPYLLWASGAFSFVVLGYGVVRLFRMLGPAPYSAESAKRFFMDQVAGLAFAIGFAALGLWNVWQILRSGALGLGGPFFVGGYLSAQLLGCAIAVYVSLGVSRSGSWALPPFALLGTQNSLPLLHGLLPSTFISNRTLWALALLYLGLRLLMQTQLSPYPETTN